MGKRNDDDNLLLEDELAAAFLEDDSVINNNQVQQKDTEMSASQEWEDDDEDDADFARAPFMARLSRYIALRGLQADWDSAEASDDEMLVNSLAMLLPRCPDRMPRVEPVPMPKTALASLAVRRRCRC